MFFSKHRKAFTLIEIVVVIAILGILSAIAIPSFASTIENARIKADETNLNLLNRATEFHASLKNIGDGDIFVGETSDEARMQVLIGNELLEKPIKSKRKGYEFAWNIENQEWELKSEDGSGGEEADTGLAAATAAVETAETSKTNETRTAAQALVTPLADGPDKTALQARLNAIVTAEDQIAAALLEATAAVETAETSKTDANKTAAQALVTELADGPEKTDLQGRLDAIITTEEQTAAEEDARIDGFKFDPNTETITITGYTGAKGSIIIPSKIGGKDVVGIGNYAFAGTGTTWPNNRSGITSIEIPPTVTTIGKGAFKFGNLASVKIPASVTSIGDEAFENNSITSVTIGVNVTSIGAYAFKSNKLTSIKIPASVKIFGDQAFYGQDGKALLLGAVVNSPGTWEIKFPNINWKKQP